MITVNVWVIVLLTSCKISSCETEAKEEEQCNSFGKSRVVSGKKKLLLLLFILYRSTMKVGRNL